MRLHPVSSPGRLLRLATLLSALVAAAARGGSAQASPPALIPGTDADTLGYPFITTVLVGRSGCITCPPRNCPEEPVLVSVSGSLPGSCYQFRGLHEVPGISDIPVLVAEFRVDTCGAPCTAAPVDFSGSASLPAATAGLHEFILRVAVRTCPDTTVIVDSTARAITYNVQADCPHPIPIDSLVRSFVKLRVEPEHPCPGDSVWIQLVKDRCEACMHLVSFGSSGGLSFAGVVDWRPDSCSERACLPETLTTLMGGLRAGYYVVNAPITVRVLGTDVADSTISFVKSIEFQVAPSCEPPPACVVPFLRTVVSPFECAVTLAPGASGNVPLLYSSELPMGGAQGRLTVAAPFRVTDLRVASHLQGVHLSWTREDRGANWLVFTDPGVALDPGTQQHLLNATVAADVSAADGESALMQGWITLASDRAGHELPLCDLRTFVAPVIQLCVSGNPSLCDVNGDARLDVRDLVRMVSCLPIPLPLPTSDSAGTNPCVDCDGDGMFAFGDIFCCARAILRGPLVPRDSVRAEAGLAVAFDPPEDMNGSLLVHVRLTGLRALGAALLRLNYPAARWRVSEILPLTDRTPEGWFGISDTQEPGRIHLGGLRLGVSASDRLDFDLVFTPIGALPPGDRLEIEGVDLAAPDGSVLVPKGTLPSVTLEATPGGSSAVALSKARPNPFTTSTSFTVNLPRAASVDLAVHDLAGRRIATIARGVFGSGERTFTWDGAGARSGLYFVRLVVEGRVLSTRVAMLRNKP